MLAAWLTEIGRCPQGVTFYLSSAASSKNAAVPDAIVALIESASQQVSSRESRADRELKASDPLIAEEIAMVNMPIMRLSLPLTGLALTWLVIHIPGEYAYASVWLMPSVAAFFAFATWFAFAYRGMDQWMAIARKPQDHGRKPSEDLRMDVVFDSVGRICIGTGVLSALIQTFSSPTHCSWELPLAMGAGVLVGAKALGKIPV